MQKPKTIITSTLYSIGIDGKFYSGYFPEFQEVKDEIDCYDVSDCSPAEIFEHEVQFLGRKKIFTQGDEDEHIHS